MASILGVAAMPGAGKGFVIDLILKRHPEGKVYYLGGAVLEERDRRGLPQTQETERAVRDEMRSRFGPAAVAQCALPKIEELVRENTLVIIDGVRNRDEVFLFRETFGEKFKLLAIHTDTDVRHERLSRRPVRPLTTAEAVMRDHAEIGNNDQGGSIALANYHIVNHFDFVLYGRSFLDWQLQEMWKKFLAA
ncbi:MAG: dephospho-CoA kinase [Patescibacteria group bacterium]